MDKEKAIVICDLSVKIFMAILLLIIVIEVRPSVLEKILGPKSTE
jgi:hypothetical protein